jgi:uncharacterized integral membrane protein
MLRFLKYLIYIPVAALLIAFALANHEFVRVSLDPFTNRDNAALSFDAPLFVVMILAGMVGVVAGGLAVWFGQGRYRRAARRLRSEAERLKADLQAAEPKLPATLSKRA